MLRGMQKLGMALLVASSLQTGSYIIHPPLVMAIEINLPDGTSCNGEIKNGKLNGRGSCQYANGDRYQGDFRNGQASGRGVYVLRMAITTRVLSGMGSSTVAGCGNLPMAISMKES